jgi:Cu(I)/Ag(I) efflux system membrane fusion protein
MNKTLTALSLAVALLAAGIVVGWGLASWRGGAVHDGPSVTGAVTPDTATPTAGERKVLYWYDPMVPTQKFDQPGKSPFMDMQLVPRYADQGEASASSVAVSSQTAQSWRAAAPVGKPCRGGHRRRGRE